MLRLIGKLLSIVLTLIIIGMVVYCILVVATVLVSPEAQAVLRYLECSYADKQGQIIYFLQNCIF